MATARATTLYTADDLFQMGDDARFELIEGDLFEMAPPMYGHGGVTLRLGGKFLNFIQQTQLPLQAIGESGFLFSRDPDTVLAPDISIVAGSDHQAAIQAPSYPTVVPLLVVEVLSPSNRLGEIARKVAIYRAAGVRLVWVVDARKGTVVVHRLDGTSATLRQANDDALDGDDVLPGFRLALAELFEG